MINPKTRNILIGVGAVLVIAIAWYFRTIVSYIIIAAILSVIGRPLVRWLKKVHVGRFKLGVSLSAFITLVAMGAFFFSLFRFLVPLLVKEFEHMANIDVSAYLKQLEAPLSSITQFFYGEPIEFTESSLISIFGERISSVFQVSHVTDLLAALAGTLGSFLIGFISVAFITFFFLRDENMFRNGLMLLVPSGYESRVEKNIDRIGYLLRRYFIGIILEILLVMSLDTIGLLLIGISFSQAVVIGMFCGLFNVIPYLGPWLGSAAGILIGLAININADFMAETLPLLGLMVLVFVTVQIIDNVLIQPFIYSSSVKAHPMEIFLVILAAGSLAGIMGMILAIPVYTIFRVFGAEFLSEVKFIRKLTENMDKENHEKHKHQK
jgi:predicted PurR-regulated permease PerM